MRSSKGEESAKGDSAIMAFIFPIHTAPSCETTHSTTCASMDGADWEHSCIEIIAGRNTGKFGCIHRDPEGLSHEDDIFISDVITLQLFAAGQGGYGKENRP